MSEFMRLLEMEIGVVPYHFVTSALEGVGRSDVMNYLSSLRQLFQKEAKNKSAFGVKR